MRQLIWPQGDSLQLLHEPSAGEEQPPSEGTGSLQLPPIPQGLAGKEQAPTGSLQLLCKPLEISAYPASSVQCYHSLEWRMVTNDVTSIRETLPDIRRMTVYILES